MNRPLTPPASKRRWLKPALLVLVVALAGGAYLAWPKLSGNGKDSAKYQFASVTRGDIEDVVTATGTLQPRDYVDVGAQVSGQLKKIHVEVGTEVKAGDLLAEIDSTVYLSKVDASRAQLRNLRAQMKQSEAELSLARVQFRRQQALMAENATTTESLQTAEASQQSAEAQLEALRAQIEQYESTLRGDEANLNYARIYAPMNGTVVSISARQGQTLNTNQQAPTILRVADLSRMTVQTQVSEADVSRLRLGMEAYFTTLGGQGRRWQGKLEKIEPTPTVTNNVVLYNALFDVPNDNRALMTQMTAQVFFVVAKAENALLVPMSAVVLAGRPGRPGAGGPRPEGGRRPAAADGAAAPPPPAAPAPATPNPASTATTPPAQANAAGDTPRRPRDGEGRVRKGTVKVELADGSVQERQVDIGVTSRVQAQVVSGLEEGERVVSGTAGATRPASAGPSGPPPRL